MLGVRIVSEEAGWGGERKGGEHLTKDTPPKKGVLVIEFFRGRARGGDNFTSPFQVLQTLFSI